MLMMIEESDSPIPRVIWENREWRINKNGYIERYVPEHPNARRGWFMEHRLVMEEYLGHFISRHDVVHHMNEIKTDNRIENLLLCSANEHSKIHKLGSFNDQEMKKKLRKKQIAFLKKTGIKRDPVTGRFARKEKK